MEQASPVTDAVAERNEQFYDQTYVSDKENTASEVSFNKSQTETLMVLLYLIDLHSFPFIYLTNVLRYSWYDLEYLLTKAFIFIEV